MPRHLPVRDEGAGAAHALRLTHTTAAVLRAPRVRLVRVQWVEAAGGCKASKKYTASIKLARDTEVDGRLYPKGRAINAVSPSLSLLLPDASDATASRRCSGFTRSRAQSPAAFHRRTGAFGVARIACSQLLPKLPPGTLRPSVAGPRAVSDALLKLPRVSPPAHCCGACVRAAGAARGTKTNWRQGV